MLISFVITRLNSRLLYSSLRKVDDHEYILIWINKIDSKTLIYFSRLFNLFTALYYNFA